MNTEQSSKLAIIGLGCVGFSLAVAFAKKYQVIGFEIDSERISKLRAGVDATLEVSSTELENITISKPIKTGLFLTDELTYLSQCNVFIITVPTPIDKNNRPDLGPLYKAIEMVGKVLKKGDKVVYESTVYPGVTEDECVPVLERVSGLRYNIDFFAGYSPERIKPSDKEHTVTKILKVTSGFTPEAADFIDHLYKSVIKVGTYRASCIKVA